MPNICHTTIIFKGSTKNINSLESVIKKEIKSNSSKLYTISFSHIEKKVPPCNISAIHQLLNINEKQLYLNDPEGIFRYEADKKIDYYIKENKWLGTREDYINERIFECNFFRENKQLKIVLEMAWYCPISFFTYMANKFDLEVIILEKVEGNFTHLVYLEDKEYKYTEYNIENILNSLIMQDITISLNLTSSAELLLLAIYINQELLAKELILKYSINDTEITNCIKNLKNLYHEDFYDRYREFLFTNIVQQENFNLLLHNLEVNAKSFIKFFN